MNKALEKIDIDARNKRTGRPTDPQMQKCIIECIQSGLGYASAQQVLIKKGYVSYGKCTVTKIGSNGSNVSSLECKFSSYGRREIRCEVVYIPKVVTDVSLRKVGSGMTEVEIIPRSN